MATLSSHNSFQLFGHPEGSTGDSSVRRFFRMLAEKWAKRRDYRDTIAELRALSDHDLDDIGISRAQIKIIAHQSTYEQG